MTKEQRIILKNLQKQVKDVLKNEVKKNEWKISSYSIYNKIGDFFVHAIWMVRMVDNNYKMILKYNIKSYISDIILWDILQMKENAKVGDSLRANGAFVAPSIQWNEASYFISSQDKVDEICSKAINDLVLDSNRIINKIISEFGSFEYYVINKTGIAYEKILKILAHISIDDYKTAVSIAQSEIEKGNIGSFKVGGKSIYELVLDFCKVK